MLTSERYLNPDSGAGVCTGINDQPAKHTLKPASLDIFCRQGLHMYASRLPPLPHRVLRPTMQRFDGGLSIPGSRTPTILLLLIIAAMWLARRPYEGVIDDARFYTVQALSALLPGRFADDLYFRFGSQDQFTLFTSIYKPVLATLGLATAAMALSIIGQILWASGLIYLARSLFRDGHTALMAAIMAIALPAGKMLPYGDTFITPRLFAEAITLWALGLMLRGRPLRALSLLAVGLTVHPLMTLPGLAVLFLYQCAERRVWWAIGAVLIAASLILVWLGIQPFVRLSETFDPAWLSIAQTRDFFVFLTKWPFFLWLLSVSFLILALLGFGVAEPLERRFLAATIVVGIGGLALTWIGGDVFHDVLIVDIQQYRSMWLLAVVANLFAAPILLRTLSATVSPVTSVVLVCALTLLADSALSEWAYIVAYPIFVIASLATLWERRRRTPLAAPNVQAERLLLGSACVPAIVLLGMTVAQSGEMLGLPKHLVPGGLLVTAMLCIAAAYAASSDGLRHAMMLPLIGVFVALIAIGVLYWDQRTPWTKFVESANEAPKSLTALLPDQKLIYWEGDVRVPWFVLRRSSYFSCQQGTGSLFFRGTAMTYQRRYDSLKPLRTLDFGMDPSCPPPSSEDGLSYSRATLVFLCKSEPELGALVLIRPIPDAPARVWTSNVNFEDVRVSRPKLKVIGTNRFFIYSCDDFR